MKYCPKCGKENKDNANFCVGCGAPFNNPNGFQNIPNPELYKPASTLGMVSQTLGIISVGSLVVCCCMPPIALITGPIAIITGIIFLVKHKDQKKNQAVMGIVLGSIGLLLGIGLLVSLLTIDMEAIKNQAVDECTKNPNSPECEAYKQLFPQWFQSVFFK